MRYDLSKLSFGAPAAERDISQGLMDYFVESDAYRSTIDGKKAIILGNRGVGKSAIFKVIAERQRLEKTVVIELSPEDYSYEMLTKTMVAENKGSWAKQGAYTSAWKYLLYVSIMKELIGRGLKLKTGPGARIYNYLRDNHSNTNDNPISILISYLKRMEGFKIGSIDVGTKTRELDKLYRLEEIKQLIPDIVSLAEKRNVIVLIDELDRGWDSSEDAQAFVAGLFQAAVSMNQDSPNIRVLVSLRRELYDSIPSLYADAQKYRDIVETITWDEPALLHLIANRIRYTVPELGQKEDAECWNAVFAEVLDYRQTKSFNYMIDRTLYRPREIIQFCTDSFVEAAKSAVLPVDYSTISKAELIYSENRIKDIEAEFRFQYPGLLSVFEVFRGRSYTIDRGDLETLCLGIATGEHSINGEAQKWALNLDPDMLIDVLWRTGFLRALAVGGVKALRRSGSKYLGPHQISHLSLPNIPRFHVHPMFRSYLAMKEAKDNSQAQK